MRLPFSINTYYTTHLSKNQVLEELDKLSTDKKIYGLRTDHFMIQPSETGFLIVRNTAGVDAATFEQYPPIEGIYYSEKPLVVNIKIKPNYFIILFFSIFFFTFIPVGIFIDEMTINGVLRKPTNAERLLFAGLGGVMPALWCYFGYIRPVRKAKNWIADILKLNITDNPVF